MQAAKNYRIIGRSAGLKAGYADAPPIYSVAIRRLKRKFIDLTESDVHSPLRTLVQIAELVQYDRSKAAVGTVAG